MAYRRLRPEDLQPTDRERQLAKTASSASGNAGAIGGGLGSALGAGLGALSLLTPAAPAAPALMGLGTSLGGALGGAIGGSIGDAQASGAEEELQKIDEERQRQIAEWQARQGALDDLLAQE